MRRFICDMLASGRTTGSLMTAASRQVRHVRQEKPGAHAAGWLDE